MVRLTGDGRGDAVAVEQTEAVVLRGVDFSQTSRIVTFLTPGRGRVACLVKGARRVKGGQGAALDTFNRLEIGLVYKDSRSVQTMTECSVLKAYGGIKSDLDKSAYGALPLEIALRVAHENEPSEGLYRALVDGLETLDSWSGPVAVPICWTLMRLMAAAGYEPALEQCCFTGRKVGEEAGFSYGGGVTAVASQTDRRLNRRELAALRAFARSERCPEAEAGTELVTLLSRYAERQLDVSLRSARVIERMYGGAPTPRMK